MREGNEDIMERPEAYPITYGVLGLLAFWGPMSGYDVKRMFDHVLAPMWGAAHSQIYNELRRMKDLGWVDMRREEQEMRPDRKVYHITKKGYEALEGWQKQSPTVFQIRDELLLKMLFGTFASPETLAAHLRAGIAFHEQRLQEHRQNLHFLPIQGRQLQPSGRPNPYASADEEDPYFRLIAHFAISLEKTYLDWLSQALNYLEATTEMSQQENRGE